VPAAGSRLLQAEERSPTKRPKLSCCGASGLSRFSNSQRRCLPVVLRPMGNGSSAGCAWSKPSCEVVGGSMMLFQATQKGRFTGACAVGLHAQGWPPGTEFLDAETGRQKSPPKCVNARRDQNPGCEWPEIPAERPYLASYRKRAVCGDWMVVCAVMCELVSSLITGNFLKITPHNRLFAGR
jgi:hypothetical protein